MDSYRVKGLVIKTIDYKDSDRLITLLTDEGKLLLRMRGCRKANSKLRYSATLFYYGEYILQKTKGGLVVVGVDTINSNYNLVENLDCFYVGCVILEVAEKLSREYYPDSILMDFILDSLKELENAEDRIKYLPLFLKNALDIEGHGLNDLYLDGVHHMFSYEDGGVVERASLGAFPISDGLLAELTSLVKFDKVQGTYIRELLTLLSKYFKVNVQKQLYSIQEVINLIDILN